MQKDCKGLSQNRLYTHQNHTLNYDIGIQIFIINWTFRIVIDVRRYYISHTVS